MSSSKTKGYGAMLAKVGSAAQRKHDSLPSAKRSIPLENILDRPHGNARSLNDAHIAELVESIAAVGLIQPLAVDRSGHLLAGGHRRASLKCLQDSQPEIFKQHFPNGQIPVRVFDFDASVDADQAIAIEAAENEKRRDYTPAEVRELAARLVEAGYRKAVGRPQKGQKSLTPALMTIVGKSARTVERYLAGEDAKKSAHDGISHSKRQKLLQRAVSGLEALRKSAEFDDDEQKSIRRMITKLQKLSE